MTKIESSAYPCAKGLAWLCMAGLLFLLAACASDPKEQEIGSTPPPGVHFGNEIALLDSATEKVAAHMTPDGRVHLVAITAGDDAYHVVVSAQGVEQKEKIGAKRYGYRDNLAITDDAHGRLHVALIPESVRVINRRFCKRLPCLDSRSRFAYDVSP